MGIVKFFNLGCVPRFFKTVKDYGGWRASLYKFYRMDSLKAGTCVGEDKFGNKYYENRRYFIGRSRWVEYAPYFALEYDASQVSPEWYGWLHYKTDLTPDKDCARKKYKWMLNNLEDFENQSGTPGQFMPYSTGKSKIQAWVSPKKGDQKNPKCP